MSYQRSEDPEIKAQLEQAEKSERRKRKIRRFLFGAVLSWITIAVVLTVLFRFYLAPLLKQKIETKGTEALGAPLKIGTLSLGIVPTLSLNMSDVEFAMPAAGLVGSTAKGKIELGASVFQLIQGGALGILILDLEDPKLELTLQPALAEVPAPVQGAPPTQTAQAPPSGQEPLLIPQIHVNREIGVRFRIRGGFVHVVQAPAMDVKLEKLSVTLNIPSVNSLGGDIAVQGDATGKKGDINLKFPIDLASHFKLDGNDLTLHEAKGQLFGFTFTADGKQDLVHGRGDWKVTGQVPELASVPVPPSFLPPGKWSGKMSFSLEASSDSKDLGWRAHTRVDVAQLKGTTHFEKDKLIADGALTANAGFEAFIAPLPTKVYDVKVKTGYVAADLTGMSIEKEELFKKAKAVPLVFSFVGDGSTSAFRVEKLDIKFANLSLRSSGNVSFDAGKQTVITAVVDKTDLAGWEAYFPILGGAPVKGTLQLNADLRGDLKKPEAMAVRLNPLLLENFEAGLKWHSPDDKTAVTGPIKANARVDLNAVGTELHGATVKLDADLTALHISSKDTFDKKVGLPLTFTLLGGQKGQQIEVKSSALRVGTSVFNVSGHFSNPQRPLLDLRIAAPNMNLAELASLSPKAASSGANAQTIVGGTANATVGISGAYDFKLGITESPVRVKANIAARIPSFKVTREPEAAPAGSAAPGTGAKAPPTANVEKPDSKPEPLLPNWPIARTAQVKADLTIAQLQYGELPVRGLRVVSNLTSGDLDGMVTIERVFDGNVKVPRFRTRLTSALPDSAADVEFNGINLQDAATFASKDWHELIKGSATGKMRAMIPHPSSKTFAERFQSSGTIAIKNAFLSSVQLDKMINESVAKIPGVGNQSVANSKGITADIGADFKAEKKALLLSRFNFLTPEKNELRAQGTIGFDKSIDLAGTAYLATAPVGGSVRSANADNLGRFVIPLKIKGNLAKPEVAFAQETIAQLAKKTAEVEVKKGVQKKLDQLQESVKQKGLDGIKDLFK